MIEPMAKKYTKFMSRNAVAEMFGVTPQTVSNWFADGILQSITVKGNRFATVESVQMLMKIYPEVGPDANRIEEYKKKMESLQDELNSMNENLRRERIYRHYAPKYLLSFVGKFIHMMTVLIGGDSKEVPLFQSQFVRCWLFGHDISKMCEENKVPYYRYMASVKQYVKALKQMDKYTELVQRNRILEDETARLKAENERLKADMDEYRERYKGVANEEKWKEQCPVLNKKIIDLDLTVRTMNILKMHGFETLAQVIKYDKFQLLKLRHFGRKCLTEIMDLIEPYGLELGMDLENEQNQN